MTCRHLSRDIHDSLECLFICLDVIPCALRWGVALVGDYHYWALLTPLWDPPFKYRSGAGGGPAFGTAHMKKAGLGI